MHWRSAKYWVLGGCVCVACLSASAQVSGTVGLVSLYKSRGVDQDGKDRTWRPALQGGVRYDWANGAYVHNWNSTGRFGDARVEVDLGAGFSRSLANGVSYDVGYVHYVYPSESSWNSGDLYGGVSYAGASFYVYRGMRSQVNKGDMYYTLTYSHPLTKQLSLALGVGLLDYGVADLRTRTDVSLGLTYALQENLSLSVHWQAANRKSDAFNGDRDGRVIAGITASF